LSNDKLKSFFKRKYKKSLSIKVLQFHIENGTAPKELSLTNFPIAFLPHDQKFVEQYDKLLKEFQIKIMELCIKRVKEQSENFDVKIQEIKQTLTDKVDNIDTLISNINKKTEEN
jgi:hypothetical protein